jgi:hypothetical protein
MRTHYLATWKSAVTSFVLLLILASCQKEADAPVNCSATTTGIAGTYKLTALVYQQTATSPGQDYLALREVCEADDLVVLSANGTYEYKDLGATCSPNGTNSGTWSVVGNTIISDGIVSGTIQGFDCRKLVVYSNDMIIPGDRITLTIEKQ